MAVRRGDVRAGVNLLSRAVAVPETNTASRLQFLPDLAEALSAIGEHGRASELLAEAAGGDVETESRARLQGAWLRFQTDPAVDVREVLREAHECVSEFERLRDDRALAHAWHLIAWVDMTYGRLSSLATAVERGRAHARAAGDAMTDEDLAVLGLLVEPTGPRPTKDVVAVAEAERDFARARGSRRVESAALLVLAMCSAFQERFDEARVLLSEAAAIDEELGGGRGSGFHYTPAGVIELLADDPARAERELRIGYDALREHGDAWFLCGVAAELADALWLQGRDDEALELTYLSEELVAEDVLVAQMMWRGARAKVLGRRGQSEEAERLAREGVAVIEPTEYALYQADALTDLAEVLRLAGRTDEAATTARKARILYDRKGVTAASRKLQALIDGLGSDSVGVSA
jgi:tetratricopeptide (TPR) repeat protein